MFLKTLLSVVTGGLTKEIGGAVKEKVLQEARRVLELEPDVTETAMERALADNPAIFVELQSYARDVYVAEEETRRVVAQELSKITLSAHKSGDAYVRRARPTLMYAFCGLMSVIVAAGVVMAFTGHIGDIVPFMEAFVFPLTAMTGVLGVGSYGRTREKIKGVGS